MLVPGEQAAEEEQFRLEAYAAEDAYERRRISDIFKATKGRVNCCLCGKFVGLNGHIPPEDPEGWEPLCRACVDRLWGRSEIGSSALLEPPNYGVAEMADWMGTRWVVMDTHFGCDRAYLATLEDALGHIVGLLEEERRHAVTATP